MGREVRRVPPNWTHPESGQGMFDQHFDDAMAEWKADIERIREGRFHDYEDYYRECADPLAAYLEDHSEPDPAFYRPWRDEEATWFQVWQTVTEGTPVTPAFETPKELIEYLVEHGDFWDQRRGDAGWSRRAATSFVNAGWAPTGIIEGGAFYAARDMTHGKPGEVA